MHNNIFFFNDCFKILNYYHEGILFALLFSATTLYKIQTFSNLYIPYKTDIDNGDTKMFEKYVENYIKNAEYYKTRN